MKESNAVDTQGGPREAVIRIGELSGYVMMINNPANILTEIVLQSHVTRGRCLYDLV